MADLVLYHTTQWGPEQLTVYNCNFCPFDTMDLEFMNKHSDENHMIDINTGHRIGLRGPQYSNEEGQVLLGNKIEEMTIPEKLSAIEESKKVE